MTRPFRFGVAIPGASSQAEWASKAKRAEELGFDVLLMPDHFGEQLAPIPALAMACAATTSIRVGTFVIDNDFRHPAVLAKELATLDLLSGGRLEVGLGAGWHGRDYNATGIAFESPGRRVGKLQETTQILKQWFENETVSFSGHYYDLAELKAQPRPAQPSGPPILIGGGGRRMLEFAGHSADIVSILPVSKADGSGFEVNDMTAESFAEKVSWVKAAGRDVELNILIQHFQITDDRHRVAQERLKEYIPEGFTDIDTDTVLDIPFELFGTVDEIIEIIRERRASFGISYLAFFQDAMEDVAPVVAALRGT